MLLVMHTTSFVLFFFCSLVLARYNGVESFSFSKINSSISISNREGNNRGNAGKLGQQQQRPKTFLFSSSVSLNEENLNGNSEITPPEKKKRVAVILCPAQFCVPADYEDFFSTLRSKSPENIEIGTCVTAPLPRTEWIKVARQLPTMDFVQGNLPVKKTLGWYFDAIDEALAQIFASESDEEDLSIVFIGHSIGGWVARAYLGGLSQSSTAVYRMAKDKVSSFITIGTPHINPESSLVDQTRGLLRAVSESEFCSSEYLTKERNIEITNVISSSISASFVSTDINELVAASSYFPLTGNFPLLGESEKGDGIVPVDLAFMESPARRVIIDQSTCGKPVRHAHVLPTPYNLWDPSAPSILLEDDEFLWYGSDTVLDQWIQYIK